MIIGVPVAYSWCYCIRLLRLHIFALLSKRLGFKVFSCELDCWFRHWVRWEGRSGNRFDFFLWFLLVAATHFNLYNQTWANWQQKVNQLFKYWTFKQMKQSIVKKIVAQSFLLHDFLDSVYFLSDYILK